MRTLRRALLAGALLAACLAPCAAAPDAADLYQQEIVGAAKAVRWRGAQLADDTLLAIAASGISWQPEVEGLRLLHYTKRKDQVYAPADDRVTGFQAARRAGEAKAAFPFALSLLLDPPDRGAAAWRDAYDYLRPYGTSLDRVLSGILIAPEKLPLLPSLRYAAADVLVWRASPRTLPLLLTMAGSGDAYLRSRGVAGAGVVAYRARKEGEAPGTCGVAVDLREWSVSAVQQRMIAAAVRQAARDGSYHVRGAAALALGLMGDDEDVPELERLARDPAYLAHAEGKDTKRIVYPVRAQAGASLARFGKRVEVPGGTLSGKELKRATRGGRDVTKDQGGLEKDLGSRVAFGEGAW